jgi:hypothetical protein
VVRALVVLLARRARRDRVLDVVLIQARYASVILSRCGTAMPGAGQRQRPARPTRRCSRPLRARDRSVFTTLALVRARRLNGNPLGGNHRTFQHLECPYQSNLSLCLTRMPAH